MKNYSGLLIFFSIFMVAFLITMIVGGDEYFILIGIFIGILILVTIFAGILEIFFPKNKLSKKLEKLSEWLLDNIKV